MLGMEDRIAIIETYLNKINFEYRRVFIFGANGYCSYIINILNNIDVSVERIIDNNKEKNGICIEGIEVVLPEKYLRPVIDNALILIASQYVNEMSAQLEMYGYSKKNIVSILNIRHQRSCRINNHLASDELYQLLMKARAGEQIIKEIKRKYGEDVYILYIPIPSLGDTYLLCAYIQAYLRKSGINNFVFLLYGKAASSILRDIGFSNVFDLKNSVENEKVLSYLKLYGFKVNRVVLLIYDLLHTQIIAGMLLYQGATMLDGYRIWLGLNKNEPKCLPKLKFDNNDVKKIIHQFDIEKKHSVILAPYANSVGLLSFGFWEDLSCRLLDKGFRVFTNISKESEKVISGTNPIMFDMKIAEPILEEAGYFIGLRSGFCDVVCNAECKKIIIYPDKDYEMGEVYDICSFKNMKIGKNIYEIKYGNGESYTKILDEIESLIIN